ncbi:MAG: pre-peptidase C-terminal domain-containing protein [Gemmatimonadales bacterium]|nr:pre-peptidase C-terminal domain-containing protein [Gemmatimonadales bacterium]
MAPNRRIWSHSVGVFLAILLSVPEGAQAQSWPSRPKPAVGARQSYGARRLQQAFPPPTALRLRAARATVTESEPNDSLATADPVTLGDTLTGVVDPAGDVDYFALNVTGGTRLNLDVDAQALGSPLDAILVLIAPDSVTVLAFNDDFDGLDSRIRFTVATTGRYFVGIASYAGDGSPSYTYTLIFGVATPGPGDPTTSFATGLGSPAGMAASAAGELFVVDPTVARIVRVSPTGSTSDYVFFGLGRSPSDIAIDGFGDLLVASTDTNFSGGVVMRIGNPSAPPTFFARGFIFAGAIAVGPDGDVWVGDNGCGCLLRFDPVGTRKDSIFVGFMSDLTFSPAGELHFSNGYDQVLKLVGRTPQVVIQAGPYLEGLAFDRDGYLYVANGYLGEVQLFTPGYQQVGGVFARSNLGGPIDLVFGRTTAGAMTSRLFAANVGFNLQPPYAGGIVEMNPAGMRAPGLRVGADLLRVTNAALRDGVVGADYADTLRVQSTPGTPAWSVARGALPPGLTLSAATGVIAGIPRDSGSFAVSVRVDAGARFGFGGYVIDVARPEVTVADAANHLLGANLFTPALERFMDLQGNRNGRYDLADFRAYLRAQGQLPTAAAASTRRATESPR